MTRDFEQDMVEALEKEGMQFILVVSDKNTKDYRVSYGIFDDSFFEKSIDLLRKTADTFDAEDND